MVAVSSWRLVPPVAILQVVFGCLAWPAQAVLGQDVVAVCPAQFRETFAAWVELRERDGLSVRVLDSHRDAEALAAEIRAAAGKATRFIVLVGDAPTMGQRCDRHVHVPVHYRPTTVSAEHGSTPMLSTDFCYGDFDGDGNPEAVVGRLPVDTTAELSRWIDRIAAHESSRDFGPWRSRVNLIGGVGGFGPLIDNTIETATRTIVTGALPAETRTTVAHASPGHKLFPKQPFTEAVLDHYREGCRFWVYAGHGLITELDRVPPRTGQPILDCQSIQRLQRPSGAWPIAFILACYSGAIDGPEDSLAEAMVRCDGGPIAVLGGSRVTMPYGNAIAAVAMIDAVYTQRVPRLGDAWLAALQHLYEEQSEQPSSTRVMIDALAGLFSPPGSVLVDQRREHMLLYNLLGDPTLKLNHPETVDVRVSALHQAEEWITVGVTSAVSGTVTISLDRPIGSGTPEDPNDITVASLTGELKAGVGAEYRIRLPAEVRGPIMVRAIVAGEHAWAGGAARTIVR